MSHKDTRYKLVMKAVVVAVENQIPLLQKATSIVEDIKKADNVAVLSPRQMLAVDIQAKQYVNLLNIANAYGVAIKKCVARAGIDYQHN